MIKYGLLNIKENRLLGLSITSNGDAESCGDCSYKLDDGSDMLWLVDNKYVAEYIRRYSTPWYNSSNESPMNPYKAEALRVIELNVLVYPATVDVEMPTLREWLKEGLKTDPGYKAILGRLDKGEKVSMYNVHQLKEFLREKKKNLK